MKSYTSIVAFLVFAIGTIGSAGPLMAGPDGSQKLRGLGGRTFEVMVKELPDGEWEHNCYIFNGDGEWIDPPFAALGGQGTWVQHSVGASTAYNAVATGATLDVFDLTLMQEGLVTPARGGGVLQLQATSHATLYIDGVEIVQIEFLSVGFQNDDCE